MSGADAAERIFIGGLPYYLTEEQCRELLASFGAIKSFDLVKDKETGQSKGWVGGRCAGVCGAMWVWWWWWWCVCVRACVFGVQGCQPRSTALGLRLPDSAAPCCPFLLPPLPPATASACTRTLASPTWPARASTACAWGTAR